MFPPFIKLELTSFKTTDENGNKINEPDEMITLNLDLHNFAPCYGADNVNFSITTEDPDITIINGSATLAFLRIHSLVSWINFRWRSEQMRAVISRDLTLHFESEFQITMGQDINLKLLVNPSGIFVYEGEENGKDYSGNFIAGFLDHLGYNYTYSNTYIYVERI